MTDITLSWEEDEDPTVPRAALPAPARVLVAEDDDAFRLLVATRLRDEGYDVMQAHSGGDALAMIHSAQLDEFPADGVDLVVVDHRRAAVATLLARERPFTHWME